MRRLTCCLLISMLLPFGVGNFAENIDPENNDSQYAYSENVGWINVEPTGNGGPGVQVENFELTGWMWGENIGWISLSCQNASTCGSVNYGVNNNGDGSLSGYAWAENVGWISFSCENTSICGTVSYGVTIDPFTGDFSGRAWAENLGWITFASDGPNPYKVQTSWICTVPSGSPALDVVDVGEDAELSWGSLPNALYYDAIRGDLGTLHGSSGDFSISTAECVVDNEPGTSTIYSGIVNPGDKFWFLVRAANCGGGLYDTGAGSQIGLRDAEIAASGNSCP